MKLEESIEKTKKFLCKSLKKLKNLFFAGYKRIPQSSSCNPFSCGSINSKKGQADDRYYTDLCDDWQCELGKAIKRKSINNMAWREPNRAAAANNGSSTKPATTPTKNKQGEEEGEKNKTTYRHSRRGEDQYVGGCYPLVRKMKDLEMMDATDMEHVLDVEEAVHYYSRLRSPAYLDIVDKFFMDMYTEFSVPHAAVSINN